MFKLRWPSIFKSAYDVEAEGAVPEVLSRVPVSADQAENGSYVTEVATIDAEKAALTYCFSPDVYAVVNLKAKMLSSLPLKIYSKRPNGSKTEVLTGPLYKLLERPNPNTTRTELILQFASWHYLTGSAYIVMEEIHGVPYLICLNSRYVHPVVVKEEGISGIVYKKGTVSFYYSDDQVIRWVNFSPRDDYYGMTPVQPLADDVQARKSTMKNTKNHYSRGGVSGGVLKTESNIEEGELRKLRKDWENRKEDSARLIILPDGWDFMEFKGSENSSKPETVLTFTLASVCNAFGVPVALMSPDKNTHPTESEIFLWTSQLLPDADVVEQKFTNTFGVENNRQKLVFELDRSGVPVLEQFRLDKTRTRAADLASGYLTINQWLEMEDREPLSGEFAEFGDTPRPVWDQKNAKEMAEQQQEAAAQAAAAKDPAGRDQSSRGEKPMGIDASGKKGLLDENDQNNE